MDAHRVRSSAASILYTDQPKDGVAADIEPMDAVTLDIQPAHDHARKMENGRTVRQSTNRHLR